jgi:precorrin-8X/cobalt-precorrin-8 methylmutase
VIVTDTNMACAGVNKAACEKLGVRVVCYMAEAEIAEAAKRGEHHARGRLDGARGEAARARRGSRVGQRADGAHPAV